MNPAEAREYRRDQTERVRTVEPLVAKKSEQDNEAGTDAEQTD